MSVNSKMTAIAEAIRAKTGKTASLTLDQMVTEIEGITGGTELYAVIEVTYPAGSTVTCVSGTTELTPIGTDGQCLFAVPYAATWIVTATDGTETATQTVEITIEGQIESITLAYGNYLYKDGNEYTAITGGWITIGKKSGSSSGVAAGEATVTRNEDNIFIDNTGSPSKSGMFVCQNKVDLSNVSKINFDGTIVSNAKSSDDYIFCELSVWTEIGTYSKSNQVASVGVNDTGGTTEGLELDVSALNDAAGYIVGLRLFKSGTVEMREVELVE